MDNAMICCFSLKNEISAAMCLIAAKLFETVGYPSNTVHWLSLDACQSKTSIVDIPSCRLAPQQTWYLLITHNRLLNAVCAYHFLMTLIYFGHFGAG